MMPVQPTGQKAICCGIEGDLHELPVQLARIVLESEGWELRSLGPNTPLFAITEMTHIAVTNDTGGGGVVWLKAVRDEEYNGAEGL